jgi:phosphate acetyltransferase
MLSTLPFKAPRRLLDLAASKDPVAMAVIGADDRLPIESAAAAAREGLIEPVLIGDAAKIRTIASDIDWDISGFEIVNETGEAEKAVRGAELAGSGRVRSLMKGQIHTDQLMRAVLTRSAGLRTERRVSHIFHMSFPDSDGELLITDAAVNVAPDIKGLMDITRNAVELSHKLGNDMPKVALLSGTESPIPSMPSSELMAELSSLANDPADGVPGAHIYGPLAFDNAVSPEAAAVKGIDNPVAGHADVLVVPNIEMGNGLFKMLVYFRSACAAGIVMGAKIPVVLTSRADPPEARLAAAAVAALVAD